MSTKIGLISLGCAKNLVDAEHMLGKVCRNNMEVTANVKDADIVIVNTCGFIESAKREAIESILEVSNLKEQGIIDKIIVTGCLAQRYKDEFLKELPEVDAVLGTGSYDKIIEAIEAVKIGRTYTSFNDIDKASMDGDRVVTTPSHTAYLKIAEGCDNRCAYCVIPSLRGRYRSRPLEDILMEAEGLSDAGIREVIVVAQDITRYGKDIYNKASLGQIIEKLCEMKFDWVRLHYLYPDEISDDLIDIIANQPKVVKYLDIPIQHINDKILTSMNRRGNKEYIISLIEKLRKHIAGVVIRTSIIVGLPGETKQIFEELCDFLCEVKLERVGVFAFCPEEGTPAYSMPDHVDDEIKNKRVFACEEIQSRIIDEYNANLINTDVTVLVEGYDRDTFQYFGRTYADSPDIDGGVYFFSDVERCIGEFCDVLITDYDGAYLLGEV